MSELNINDLPHEMLITVFRFLNASNLKNATLACKLWNNLIDSACRWSFNLELDCYAENRYSAEPTAERDAEQKVNFILATKRKFERIGIVDSRLREGSQILEIFRKHGFHVVKLHLSKVHIDSLNALAELLNLTPNLKCVEIQVVILHDVSDVPDHVLPELKKLTNLEMYVTDYRFTQCFRKAKLTTIKIYEDEDSKYRSTLAPFILSQDKLTSLTAESYTDSPSVLAEMGELDVPIPLRLTQLAISDMDGRDSPHDHNLLKVVKSQTNSLTEMEIGDEIPSSVYECVFASMTKLNTFGVVLNHIPQGNDFYERLQENGSVCTMKILATELEPFYDAQCFGSLLKKLPNIRNLFLSSSGCMYKNVLVVAAKNLSKLESLHVDFFDECLIDHIGCVKFTNLKTLHIGILEVRIDWNEFTKSHSRLIELTIETMNVKSVLTSDDIDQITTNLDLQNLKLGDGFVADYRFFEIIRKKCPNLKLLYLHNSCISHDIDYNKEINLLRLCDDLECSKYAQMMYEP